MFGEEARPVALHDALAIGIASLGEIEVGQDPCVGKTGEQHPSMTGRLTKDRDEPLRYLQFVWDRWPGRTD